MPRWPCLSHNNGNQPDASGLGEHAGTRLLALIYKVESALTLNRAEMFRQELLMQLALITREAEWRAAIHQAINMVQVRMAREALSEMAPEASIDAAVP